MIFYQGKGYLVYLLPIAIFIGATVIDSISITHAKYLTLAAELMIAYISFKDHKNNPHKYLDKETGEKLLVEHKNTIFWIKAEYWAILISIIILLNL